MKTTPTSFFTLETTDPTGARAGHITTAHGIVPTPIFMPVGTQGAVKAMDWAKLQGIPASIVLANTYHMYLRPGTEVLESIGGLHRFCGWNKPILTDSGGFQVWSLRDLRTIDEHGVRFRSHLDGSTHEFTPERVVNIQRSIGSDIFMVLDECTPYPVSHDAAQSSMERTVRWAERATEEHQRSPFRYGHRQYHFAIGQGSIYRDLREQCMSKLVEMPFDGYAIGGLSVGEPTEKLYEVTRDCTAVMPPDAPRYLMGVGTPENILRCIALGVDMFDCVMPTRNARNGTIYTSTGKVNIRNSKWKLCTEALDSADVSADSSLVQMAYLRHLFMANEILGLMIATQQNVSFYLWLIRSAREQILNGTYAQWMERILPTITRLRTS